MKHFSQLTKIFITLGVFFISCIANASNANKSEIDTIISESLINLSQSEHSDLMSYAQIKLEVKNLVLAGKGVQALKLSESSIDKHKNSEIKAESISLTIDVCLMLGDLSCFNRIYDNYSDELDADVTKYFKPEAKLVDIALKKHHRLDAYSTLYDFYFSDIGNQYTSEIDNDVLGLEVDSKYSSLARTAYAARNIANFNTKEGMRQLRLARALMLVNDLNDFITQWHYAELVDNSTSLIYDMQDIRNFIEIRRFYIKTKKNDVSESFNPYAKVLLYTSAIDSGLLSDEEEVELRVLVSNLFDSIELSDDSLLKQRESRFYSFNLLENIILKNRVLDTNILKKLQAAPVSYESLSTLALISLVSGEKNNKDKDRLQAQIEYMDETLGSLPSGSLADLSFEGTRSLMSALLCRMNSNDSCEKDNFIKYANSYLEIKNKFSGKFNPSSVGLKSVGLKSDRIIGLYVINRLKEIGYNSPLLDRFTFELVNSIHEQKNKELVSSRSLISSFDDENDKGAAKQYLSVVSVYNEELYRSFLSLFFRYKPLKKTDVFEQFTTKEYVGEAITLLSEYENNWLYKNKSDSKKITLEDIRSHLESESLAILSTEADGIEYLLLIDSNTVVLRIVDKKNKDLQAARSLLAGGNIYNSDIKMINDVLLNASSNLFSDVNFSKYQKIYFLTGPAISGIPYTLLKFNYGESRKYLIEKSQIITFDTVYEYYDLKNSNNQNKFELSRSRGVNYMAFANPEFGNASATNEYAVIIRGGSSSSVSNLAYLPETQIEATKFSANIEGQHKLFFQKNASETNFLNQNYDDVEILTIATHGVLPGELIGANSPSIVLTPDSQNGLIDVNEILATFGAPKLVVLSTCNSATTNININFSQVSSISQAYQLKGTNSVVASMWQVDSFATQELMVNFSSYLKAGQSSSEALRLAQIDMLKSKYSHPSMWAAFVVSGVYYPKNINSQLSDKDLLVSQSLLNTNLLDTTHAGNYQYLSTSEFQQPSDNNKYNHNLPNGKLLSSYLSDDYKVIQKGIYILASDKGKAYYVKPSSDHLVLGYLDKDIAHDICHFNYSKYVPYEFIVSGNYFYFSYIDQVSEPNKTNGYVLQISMSNCSVINESNFTFRDSDAYVRFIKSDDASRVSIIASALLDTPLKLIDTKIGDLQYKSQCGLKNVTALFVFNTDNLEPIGLYDLPGYSYLGRNEYENNVTLIREPNCLYLYNDLISANLTTLLIHQPNANDLSINVKNLESASTIKNIKQYHPVIHHPVWGDSLPSGNSYLSAHTDTAYRFFYLTDDRSRDLRSALFKFFIYNTKMNKWIPIEKSACRTPVVEKSVKVSKLICITDAGLNIISSNIFH